MKSKRKTKLNWSKAFLLFLAFAACLFLLSACSSGASDASPSKAPDDDVEVPDVSAIVEQYLPVESTLESEGGKYYGPSLDSVYTGYGRFEYTAGGVYEGEFVDSLREGTGTFTWENGDSFTGTWKKDKMVEGTYTFANGSTFTGTFKDNKFTDGSFTAKNIPKKYNLKSFSANYVSGKVDTVKFTTTDGTKYDGKISGEATITYASGNKYKGKVSKGVRSGTGTYYWVKDGKTTAYYEGAWKKGKMEGEGKYHYSSKKYPYVKGTFTKGKLNGKATYYNDSKHTFTTTWEDGVCKKVEKSKKK